MSEELKLKPCPRCRNCWANDATDAAQCRLCGLKKALKGGGRENEYGKAVEG